MLVVKFLPNERFNINSQATNALKEAYKAFGSVIGKYVKPFQKGIHPIENGKIFPMPALDPHGNNIFYDITSKTVTWIDLQKTGEYFNNKQYDTYSILSYATHDVFGKFFFKGYGGQLFKNSVEFFYPEHKADPALKVRFIGERDRIFNEIKGILEAFIEGFITNWPNSADKELLKKYFKLRWKFPYSTPAEHFSEDDPFVFKY